MRRRTYLRWLIATAFVVGRLALAGISTSASQAGENRRATQPDESAHWAFVPPVRPELPEVRGRNWIRNPIDAFILAGLEEFGLSPAPEADRTTLLRRLSFDLTGLPPTPEEIETFLADTSTHAYEKQVDRLLDSPHYGERWAQHWLDLARYADTDGFEFDQARPDAWRFRDWVVSAFNRDIPYNRFVQLQLAGDELEPGNPEAFIATGFHRCYPDMVDLNDQGLRRQNALNDITETTGLVFLGLTMGCARCHDHKFDPIRQTDFYQLQAFFMPVRFRDDFVLASEGEVADHEAKRQAWNASITAIQAELLRLEAPIREQIAPGLPAGLNDRTRKAFLKAESERSSEEIGLIFEALSRDHSTSRKVGNIFLERAADHPIEEGQPGHDLDREIARTWKARSEALDQLRKNPPPPLPLARGLDEPGGDVPPTHLLVRGDYESKGPVVEPRVPAFLSKATPTPTIQPTTRSSGRRRALAEWLTRPEHPLTARVMVNRLWQEHFGRGIVASPSDFGTMGEPPSHPELLDWLACEFVSRGWSLKAMHRLIVTSATYRQSARLSQTAAKLDPENMLLWQHRRRRLDGEAIRDAMLAVSGRLNKTMGGPGIFPELPEELMKLSSKGAVWPVSRDEQDRNRRSLYVFIRRNLRYPFFEAFDRPDTNASCPKRAVTTIAPQALSLFNGRIANDCARALAERVLRESGPSEEARIETAYRLALGRRPDTDERRLAMESLRGGLNLTDFCLALINVNEFVYID